MTRSSCAHFSPLLAYISGTRRLIVLTGRPEPDAGNFRQLVQTKHPRALVAGAKNPVRGLGIRFQGKVIEVAGVFLYPPRLVKPDDQTAKACDAGRRRLNLEGGVKTRRGTSFEGAPRHVMTRGFCL